MATVLSFFPGKVIHSMTAHMDAVTGLAIDPHGLCLLSGSEYLCALGPPLCFVSAHVLPVQVTMAHLGSGTLRARSVCRKSWPTENAMTSPYSTLRHISQSRILLVPVRIVLQRYLCNSVPNETYIGTTS